MKKSLWNIPTILTLIRIIAIPLVVIAFYLPFHWGNLTAGILFALACITDWFDGFLARNLSQTTRFGAFLDPVADKLIVAVSLVIIVGEGIPYLAIPAAIIVGREIIISALREWMAEIGRRTSVAVTLISKIKTLIQMLAVFLLLIYKPGANWMILWGGYVSLYIAAVLTLWTMVMYLKAAWPDLTLPEERQ